MSVNRTFTASASLEDDWKQLLESANAPTARRDADGRPEARRRTSGRSEGRPDADGYPSRTSGGYRFVYLPGLKNLANILNGTAGVRNVGSSRIRQDKNMLKDGWVHVTDSVTIEADAAGGDAADGDGGDAAEGVAAAGSEAVAGDDADDAARRRARKRDGAKLRVQIFGVQKKTGAIQLRCRGGVGWESKLQTLFITPAAEGFDVKRLTEVLTALAVLRDFELVRATERL